MTTEKRSGKCNIVGFEDKGRGPGAKESDDL